MQCATATTQCNDDCVFNSVDPASEYSCRAGCAHDTSRCVSACVVKIAQEKKRSEVSKKKSPKPDTFKSYTPPRSYTENVGFGPESALVSDTTRHHDTHVEHAASLDADLAINELLCLTLIMSHRMECSALFGLC
jgi:hypothetical protein